MALIDVVEWSNKEGEILHRFPEGDVVMGAQLIVREQQIAYFMKEGQLADALGPGRHTLESKNIPLLEKLVNLPFGGKSPFPAEIFFLNNTIIPDLKWGTPQPMQIMDPEYNLAIPVRAFGSYTIKIKDPKEFLLMAIGAWNARTTDDIAKTLRDQIIMTRLQDLISEFMIKQNISALKLMAYLDEMGDAGKKKIEEEFHEFQLELVKFNVQSVNIPDEDESVKRLKKALADKAELNIMGDDYAKKRSFDTMEKAAGNEGMAGGMMGAGMGFSMGNQMGSMMNNTMNTGQQPNMQQQTPSQQAGGGDDPMAKLQKLKQMMDAGLITEEEYSAKKNDILSNM